MVHEFTLLGTVALAMLLGGVIGFEREIAQKPAGFRTHMLVSGAAALLVGLSAVLVEWFASTSPGGVVAADPIRVIQAVIIGVSFLGTGTIVRSRHHDRVEGLSTAASLLLSSAVGIAVALRLFVLAVGATILAAVVLRLLGRIDRRLHPHRPRVDD